MPESLDFESVQQLDLTEIRNDGEKLFVAASNLQYTLLQAKRDPLQSPSASRRETGDSAPDSISSAMIRRRHTNRHWMQANREHPNDSRSFSGCFGTATNDVLHFNAKARDLELIPLNDLRGKYDVPHRS
jgi:hypothetical protein